MVKSGQPLTVLFETSNATTGASSAADSTPAATLYLDGTANGATVTVTQISGGLYKAAVTLPSLTAGQVVSLRATATVAGIAGGAPIFQDIADTVRMSDPLTANPGTGGIVSASFGASAIDAAAIAADAIGALELAAGAASKIATAVRAELATELARVDAAITTRLATAGYTAPPTAAENADATLDELLSGHVIPGSAGATLSAAGSAGDPLLNSVPGSYAAGTAGAALARIANEPIAVTITSPVTSDGDFEMIVGDDWAVSESRQFDFALIGIVDLTGATVTWYTNLGGVTASKAMTIVTNTATTATVRLTLTASESAAWRAGIWAFGIRAVLSNAHVVTLVSGGRITVRPAVA